MLLHDGMARQEVPETRGTDRIAKPDQFIGNGEGGQPTGRGFSEMRQGGYGLADRATVRRLLEAGAAAVGLVADDLFATAAADDVGRAGECGQGCRSGPEPDARGAAP